MKTPRASYGMEGLRGAFSAATLRRLLDLRDSGRVALGRVKNVLGGAVVESDGRDLLVHVVDVLSGLPALARLHVPANILWRKPKLDETLVIATPADINSPGGPVAIYGDAGAAGAVPPWLDTAAGIYADEEVRVQSANHDVVIHAKTDQKVKLGEAATKGVMREGDYADAGSLIFLPNVGTTAAQLQYFAPGAVVPVPVPPAVRINLVARMGTGSVKVKAED